MTTSRLRPRALAALLCVALLPALTAVAPSAASAGELRFRDATADVQSLDLADGLDEGSLVTDPSVRNGDIRSVFVHYRAGRLVIRANFVDLVPRRRTQMSFGGAIRTNENRRWEYSVDTAPDKYAGHDTLRRHRDGRIACEIGHRIDYARNFARVVVPLRCLSNPRWVKVSLGMVTFDVDRKAFEAWLADGDPDSDLPRGVFVVHADDGHSPGLADRTAWTPRVHR